MKNLAWGILFVSIFLISTFAYAAEGVGQRKLELELGLAAAIPLDKDFSDQVGPVLVGEIINVKFIVVEHLGISLNIGGLGGYHISKQDVLIPPTFQRTSFDYATLGVLGSGILGFTYEILPKKQWNPYVGAMGGGYYVMLGRTITKPPKSMGSEVQMNDLVENSSNFLPAFGGLAGVDYRFSRPLGMYLEARYFWLPKFKTKAGQGKAEVTYDVDIDHIELQLGMVVHYF